MRMTDETITIFNQYLDEETGMDAWKSTVIRGVSYFADIASAVDGEGLKAAAKYVIRIPEDVDTGSTQYIDPYEFAGSGWTLRNGDIIVKGEVSGKLSELRQSYPVATVLAVTDNRRASRGKHWKVVCA